MSFPSQSATGTSSRSIREANAAISSFVRMAVASLPLPEDTMDPPSLLRLRRERDVARDLDPTLGPENAIDRGHEAVTLDDARELDLFPVRVGRVELEVPGHAAVRVGNDARALVLRRGIDVVHQVVDAAVVLELGDVLLRGVVVARRLLELVLDLGAFHVEHLGDRRDRLGRPAVADLEQRSVGLLGHGFLLLTPRARAARG